MDNEPTLSEMPRVIYIMGTARSGSTILEILLGTGEGVFGAGELTSLVEDGFVKDAKCSCNEPTSKCLIWSRVRGELSQDNNQMQQLSKLQKKVDWHDGFLRQLFGRLKRNDMAKYAEQNRRLLAAIRKVTNCRVVLDSSKYAGRALALKRIVKTDISVICLTRSPAGLMSSFQKQNIDEQTPKSAMNTLVYYVVTLASLRFACRLLGDRVTEIRYEDFVSDPINVLERIESSCEIDLSETKSRIKQKRAFDVGHIVTGNRLRKSGEVFLQTKSTMPRVLGISRIILLPFMQVWKWGLGF